MSDEGASDNGMTCREAGRRGGRRLVSLYGPEHMAKIGHAGGSASPTKFKKGDPETAKIAAMGGMVSGGNFKNNPDRAAEAGRKGGKARARNYKAKK